MDQMARGLALAALSAFAFHLAGLNGGREIPRVSNLIMQRYKLAIGASTFEIQQDDGTLQTRYAGQRVEKKHAAPAADGR